MFGSTVLEVAVGLTFCYATVALIVSTVQEALASLLRLRARTLLSGIKTMLNDPGFNSLACSIYTHALVNPHDDGGANPRDIKNKPSYIEPKAFAVALIDNIQSIPGDYEQLGRDIDALDDPQVRRVLQSIHQRAGGDIEVFQASVAGWFDSAMERVSGAYKRRSLLVSLLLSLLLAALFNIDSIQLFRALWQQPALAAQLALPTAGVDPRAIDALFTLPIGWQSFPPALDGKFLLMVAGWMLTASTALFGAPFWFDLMQRTVQLRGAGAKPEEPRAAAAPVAAAAPAKRKGISGLVE
ncbi:hypothetical protein [Massilia glaciei]|uniref:Uncharacterized protein n=1 Tax=Massilia glaciei TaxID=1524097 RepID=A0A2U2HHM5_9BURK|nr:hypothetical protein [Massilia glaciei]PWF45402.1 hypothetical protein C7C56_017825 [Massilia glaciei]